MKKFLFATLLILLVSQALRAEIIDELSFVSDKSDLYMYVNTENITTFLQTKGVNIRELDEILGDETADEKINPDKDFDIKMSDVREILFAGRTEDLEKKGGFLLFLKVAEGKGQIPPTLKAKSIKIKNITFYETDSSDGMLVTLINNTYVVGHKEYCESYVESRNLNKKNLSESAADFKKNVSGKTLYLNVTMSEYLKSEMNKAYQQGAMMAKGLNQNVFIKTLLNLKSIDYGVQVGDRINFFAGIQGHSAEDSERLLMISHFAIVGTSLAASFADMIAAKNDDNPIGKVTENGEFISDLQQVIGRMKTTQTTNGVVVSFYTTEKETDSLIVMLKKGIVEEKKARAERKESRKISAITKAITEKNSDLAEKLLNEKIDINKKDLEGNTILSAAALMGDTKIATLALTRGAYVDNKSSEGMTPLHNAAKGGSAEMVSLLLKKGADVNAKDENEMTPLHFNAQQGNAEVTKILVNAGADVNAIAMDGSAPVHLACEGGYLDIIKVLAEKKADFSIIDANRERGVDIASRNGHAAIVEFFKNRYNLEPAPVQQDDSNSDNNLNNDFNDNYDGENGGLSE